MTGMKGSRRVAIVVLGYLAAFAGAWVVVFIYIAATNTADRQTSQGMYAFGDTMVFLGAFGLASLPASAAALFFLRDNRLFWVVLSATSLAVAATGIASAIAYVVRFDHSYSWLQTLSLLSPLRLLTAPLLAMAFLLSGLMAPARLPRVVLFLAAAAEAAIFMAVPFQWFRTVH